MVRIKDQIRLAKMALKQAKKNPNMYSKEELEYMVLQLRRAKIQLKKKQLLRKQEKGFTNDYSKTSNRNSQRRENDGVRSEGKQPKQSGKS